MALEIAIALGLIVLFFLLSWYFLFHQGRKYIKAGKYKQAIHLYNWLIRLTPSHSMAYNNRGYAKYCLGNIPDALKDYERAIELNPQNSLAVGNWTVTQVGIGEFDKVLTAHSDRIENNRQDPGAYFNRGFTFYKRDDFDAAIEDFNQVINLLSEPAKVKQSGRISHPLEESPGGQKKDDKMLSNSLVNRGICFHKLKDADKALEDMNQALRINPRHKDAAYMRGFIHYRKGNLDLSLANYNRAIEIDDQFAYPYGGRGKCYFEQGDLQAALENFTHARDLDTTELYSLAGLAITYLALGKIEEAQELWRSLLEKDNQHNNLDWVAETYGWNVALVHEAERLIASLQ